HSRISAPCRSIPHHAAAFADFRTPVNPPADREGGDFPLVSRRGGEQAPTLTSAMHSHSPAPAIAMQSSA
ncbi:unnamed protein product, partial [Nesidiocoris tenuis]